MFKKIKILLSGILVILIALAIYLKFINKNKIEIPKITLSGKNIITIYQDQEYKEPGYKATDPNDGNITNQVKIKGQVQNGKIGTYELIYTVTNSKDETAEAHRFVKIIQRKEITYKDEYDNIDNQSRGWWSNNKSDGKRPSGGADINELKKYNAFFMGPDEKVLYLTFDEGGLETYVKEIVDVLDKNNVKATFFLCRKFIEENAELIKQMAETGHTIANHTSHQLNMPSLATRENFDKYLQEIKDKKGHLVKLGLCDFADLKVCGMGLNEGAVQLMASKAIDSQEEIVKYYGISLPTTSPSYYPILCNLVKQMAYVAGEETLYDSTFYGSDMFKEHFSDLCGINAFFKIQSNLDKIIEIEEKAIKLDNKLMRDDCEGMKAQRVAKKVEDCKEKIKKLFFETQNLIYSSYFNKQFSKITTIKPVKNTEANLNLLYHLLMPASKEIKAKNNEIIINQEELYHETNKNK